MALIDHIEAVAKRKMDTPGWEPYAWEAIGTDGTMVTGSIPRLLKSGPRKGEKTWDGKGDKVVVVKSEILAEMARYEKETGKCCQCMGQGKVAAGWSSATGPRYRPCLICKGTGYWAEGRR
jgi:hypothetical protein